MKTTKEPERSGRAIGIGVSIVGLALIWSVVWANLPSKQELLSANPKENGSVAPAAPELDLTIPGVSPHQRSDESRQPGAAMADSSGEPAAAETTGAFSVPSDVRARKIAEIKCDAVVQEMCPDSLTGEERQRCVAARMKQLPSPCQQIMRRRLVRWREADGYKAACRDDVERFCPRAALGDGRILTCLQEHEQDLSEECYQSLPKGRLLLPH